MDISENTSSFPMPISNRLLPVGTANTLVFSTPPQALPSEYQWLEECGSGWVYGIVVEAATGLVRYTDMKEHPTGSFLTDLRELKSEEAINRLQLPNHNKALYEHRVIIPANTPVCVGKIPHSEDHQVFVPNKEILEFYDPKETMA